MKDAYLIGLDKKPFFVDEYALIALLDANILFAAYGPDADTRMLSLCINCNELFYYGADAEDLTIYDLQGLYDAWKSDTKWSVDIWICKHRGLQPRADYKAKMIKDGVWTEELEKLEKNQKSQVI